MPVRNKLADEIRIETMEIWRSGSDRVGVYAVHGYIPSMLVSHAHTWAAQGGTRVHIVHADNDISCWESIGVEQT